MGMRQRRAGFVGLSLSVVALALGCGSRGGNGYTLDVGTDDGGPSFPSSGTDASGANTLDAYIEQGHVAVKFITLSCSGDCATVEAVGTGGHPPYTFKWDDDSTTATRQVCPTASTNYSVRVTDTGMSGELARAPETVQVPLTANVLACPDGGAAGGSAQDGGCDGGPLAPLRKGWTGSLPETLAIDVHGAVTYFENGASLPAGRYRIEYVSGCMEWGLYALGWHWTIDTPAEYPGGPLGQCLLVGDSTTNVIAVLPGTTGAPGYDTYSDCVSANMSMDAPLDFDFSGGKLALWMNDTNPGDDSGGESACGLSPVWRLSLLSASP
jgi:hypothetical protein